MLTRQGIVDAILAEQESFGKENDLQIKTKRSEHRTDTLFQGLTINIDETRIIVESNAMPVILYALETIKFILLR
jgi:hypothetical protein